MDLKNVDYAFPDCLASERLFDGHRLKKHSRAAVPRFHGLFQFLGVNVNHCQQLYTVYTIRHRT